MNLWMSISSEEGELSLLLSAPINYATKLNHIIIVFVSIPCASGVPASCVSACRQLSSNGR